LAGAALLCIVLHCPTSRNPRSNPAVCIVQRISGPISLAHFWTHVTHFIRTRHIYSGASATKLWKEKETISMHYN